MNTNRIAVAQAMALALALAMPGCSGGELGSVPTFIALQSDFAPYRSWTRVALGDAPLEGHPPGPRFGFVKDKAPR